MVRDRVTEVIEDLQGLGLQVAGGADLDPLVKTTGMRLGQVPLQNPTTVAKEYLQGLERREARRALDIVKDLHLGPVLLQDLATEMKGDLHNLEKEAGCALDKMDESHLAGVLWNWVATEVKGSLKDLEEGPAGYKMEESHPGEVLQDRTVEVRENLPD